MPHQFGASLDAGLISIEILKNGDLSSLFYIGMTPSPPLVNNNNNEEEAFPSSIII